jgi:hypothetical protein
MPTPSPASVSLQHLTLFRGLPFGTTLLQAAREPTTALTTTQGTLAAVNETRRPTPSVVTEVTPRSP